MSDNETPWEYLPDEEEGPRRVVSPEEAAMHVEEESVRRIADPGRADVDVGDEDTSVTRDIGTFDDEEPEIVPAAESEEREPDVQELLEHQGYAQVQEEEDVSAPAGEESEDWRHRLHAERLRIVQLRHEMTGEMPVETSQRQLDGELSSMDQHQADAASMTYEREVELSLLHRLEEELAEIDDALGRLDRGEFGVCSVCHEPIGNARLRAEPATRFCITHQRGLGATGTTV